jgi:hypothetical protein
VKGWGSGSIRGSAPPFKRFPSCITRRSLAYLRATLRKVKTKRKSFSLVAAPIALSVQRRIPKYVSVAIEAKLFALKFQI